MALENRPAHKTLDLPNGGFNGARVKWPWKTGPGGPCAYARVRLQWSQGQMALENHLGPARRPLHQPASMEPGSNGPGKPTGTGTRPSRTWWGFNGARVKWPW